MSTIHAFSIARSLVLASAIGAQAMLAIGCGAGAGGEEGGNGDVGAPEGKGHVGAPEATGTARAADSASPVLAALVMTGNGGGVWSNSDNTSGTCGLFRNFVIVGTDPAGTVINPTGTWSTYLEQPLSSGDQIYTMLGSGDMSEGWAVQVWFDGLSTPLDLCSGSPTGTVTVGGVSVFASAHVEASTLDLVSACSATPDGVPDTIGYVVLTVPY